MLARFALAACLTTTAAAQTWVETSKLQSPLGASGDYFGGSLSLSGQRLLVGAIYDDIGYPIKNSEGLAYDPLSDTLLATETTGKQLVRIDLATGIAVPLGTLPAGEGLAFDPGAGLAYTVASADDSLHAVDPVSWTVTRIGPTANPQLSNIRGLTFDTTSGTLYAVDTGSNVLAVIDTATGAGTVVGSLGVFGVTALACDPSSGALYGVSEALAELLSIDPVTGAATPIGPLGYKQVRALTFDTGGVLYAYNSYNSVLYKGLLTVDPSTGTASELLLPGALEDQGGAYVIELASGATTELRASDGAPEDEFGWDVALDGDVAVIGAWAKDDQGPKSGAAYVFERDPVGAWSEFAKLRPSDLRAGDRFGATVSVSGDTVAVSAPWHAYPGLLDRTGVGALYVFGRSAGWAQTQKIHPPVPDLTQFGSCSLDGNRLLVGYPDSAPSTAGSGVGRAYVYERSSPAAPFALAATLAAAIPVVDDYFGEHVTLRGDYAAVSATRADCDGGSDCGAVYVFERDAGGPGAWGQVAHLVEPTAGQLDRFGNDLSIWGDTLLVGYAGSDVIAFNAGAVVEFARVAGTWKRVGPIYASDREASHAFGTSVSLSGDTFAAGAPGSSGSGAAYGFDR